MHKFVAVLILLISMTACGNKKQVAAAKGNSVAYAKARCTCEKQKKKTPPGDLARCTDDMARATRYLKINFEFNNFSDAQRREIDKAGDDAFTKCMAEP
jgi:hypothetical protein